MEQDMGLERDTIALILAGGNGTRLGELTRWQCKPAITFGGSAALHERMNRIFSAPSGRFDGSLTRANSN